MLKQSAAALCSSGASRSSSSSSSSSSNKSSPLRFCRKRCYATAQEPKWSDSRSHDAPAWPRSPNPTPYDILDIRRGAPYTKRRFYQLVKLYHPDTHDHRGSSTASAASSSTLTEAARLERYRLVVAANDLLSDPAKRRLYDTAGIGWTQGHHQPSLRETDRSWREQAGSAAHNATWEDWERWRQAQTGQTGRSTPLYMSNSTFAAIVVIMCMIGAVAQSNRAEHMGTSYVETLEQRHANITAEMRKNHRATAGLSKDERVQSFVKDRENVLYAFAPKKYDASQESKRACSGHD